VRRTTDSVRQNSSNTMNKMAGREGVFEKVRIEGEKGFKKMLLHLFSPVCASLYNGPKRFKRQK